MATRWLGTASEDWNTAGNWSNGIPAANDDVIVAADAVRGMSLNLDRTGDTAGAGLDLDNFFVEEGFLYDIGSSSSRLKLVADKIRIQHPGEFWFESKNGASATTTNRVILDGYGVYDILMGGAGADGQIDSLEILGGGITVTCTGSVVMAGSPVSQFGIFITPIKPVDVEFVISGAGPQITLLTDGGTISWSDTSAAPQNFIQMCGGEFTLLAGGISLDLNGGRFNYDATGYTVAFARLMRGIFDANRTQGVKMISDFIRSTKIDYRINPDFVTWSEVVIGE